MNRKTNETKEKLEEALYTEDENMHLDNKQLELLATLSEIKRQNEKLDEMSVRVETRQEKKTREKLLYYSEKNEKIARDNRGRIDMSKDGSLRVEREIRELDSKIHGSAVDVIELINNVGKKQSKKR